MRYNVLSEALLNTAQQVNGMPEDLGKYMKY